MGLISGITSKAIPVWRPRILALAFFLCAATPVTFAADSGAWDAFLKESEETARKLTATENDLRDRLAAFRAKYGGAESLASWGSDRLKGEDFKSADQELRDFQSSLDHLTQAELDFTAESATRFMVHELQNSDRPERNELIQGLEAALRSYEESSANYGGPQDFKRFSAFAKLMREARQDAFLLKGSSFDFYSELSSRLESLSTLTRISGEGLRVLWNAFRNRSGPGDTSFNNSVESLYRKWGEASGISVQVDGKEKIAFGSNAPSKIRVFAPVHRDGDLDMLAVSHLGLKDKLIFGALNLEKHPIFGVKGNPLAAPLVRSIANHDNFILLGDKNSSEPGLDKLIRLVREGKSKNVMIFPEGQVSLGLMETRPVREKFSTGLLERLSEEGLDYEVVPITLHDSGRLLHYDFTLGKLQTEGGESELHVQIHDPIPRETIEAMKAGSEDGQAFNRVLRQIWLENLTTDPDRLMGQATLEDAISHLKKITGSDALRTGIESARSEALPHRAGLLGSASEEIAARLDLIRNAKSEILVTSFKIEQSPELDAFLGELAAKAREGVRVKILVEEIGQGTRNPSLGASRIQALRDAGAELKFYSPPTLARKLSRISQDAEFALSKLHSKLQIVDGKALLIGSSNLASASLRTTGVSTVELNAVTAGPSAESARSYFKALWESPQTKMMVPHKKADQEEIRRAEDSFTRAREWVRDVGLIHPDRPKSVEEMTRPVDRVSFLSDSPAAKRGPSAVLAGIEDAIQKARSEILISTQSANMTRRMRASLKAARDAGAKVNVLTNSSESINNRQQRQIQQAYENTLRKFADDEIDLREYPGQGRLRSKAMVVDQSTSVLGSFNWDETSEFLNFEAAVSIEGQDFGRELASRIQSVAAVSSPVVREGTLLRPFGPEWRLRCPSLFQTLNALRGFR